MPRYIGYNFTGTANSTVLKGGDNYFNSTTLLLHFDGDVTDATGNYSPITNTSTSETTIVKYGSGSRRFNNTKLDYASTLLDFGSADWTVEGWVYWDGTAGFGGIVINSSSTSWDDGINFYNNGSTIGLFTPSITTTISSGQWYHFAIVRESGVWAWWLDGSRVGTATAGFTDTGATSSFGFHSATSQYPFYGYLDEIRVTDGVARYNTASTSISVPTQAYLDGGVPDRKYNSGVWSIGGSGKYSVIGRRKQGNWLTTLRNNATPEGPILAEILVVAGGGAGGGIGPGGYYRGGGGAGGYRAFTDVSILSETNYTAVVGAGGSGPTGSNGSDSSISGPNLSASTYTSAGGGHGGSLPAPGGPVGPGAGGSGGGLPGYQTTPQKAGNIPPTTPPQGNPGGGGSLYGAGAGGGAGGPGVGGSGNGKGGNGGPGATWSVNGTTYAGGGGGGNGQTDPGQFGVGGSGGGGDGGGGNDSTGGPGGSDGATNTGGGGGGRTNPGQTIRSGGSGIVIIAVPPFAAPRLSGDGTPSIAPAPAGGKTLFTFTSPGTLTVT